MASPENISVEIGMGFNRSRAALIAIAILYFSVSSFAADVTFDARTARSGNWSDAQTWANGRAPKAGDFVQIRAGDHVTYDVSSDHALRMIHVAGSLTFSRVKSTKLSVGLIKIQAGAGCSEEGFDCDAHDVAAANDAALEIGTSANPIPANVTATIRLTYFAGTDPQTLPAIIDCGGRWDVHGAPMDRTWVKLGASAMAGSNSITLSQNPEGWRAGDRILLTTSDLSELYAEKGLRTGSEERRIESIDGAVLKLDKPLEGNHLANGSEVSEVANLSRNVVIESADPKGVRGHTMYHRNSTGGISYAEFRHLGKKDVLGKYPIHFHLVRDSMRGSGVIGASIWDSENRFMAIHGTDYLLVRDCVGYQCIGHGYFLEGGTEQYNILDRNLAVRALRGKRLPHQALEFDDNQGAGFWWANGRNSLTRNVSCENGLYGYLFEVGKIHSKDPVLSVRQPDGSFRLQDIRTIPFLRFEGNESHSNGIYGFKFGADRAAFVHSDVSHPFIARNLRAWQEHYAYRPNVEDLLTEDLKINHATYGVYNPEYAEQVYRNIYLYAVNGEPINRGHDDDSYQNGSFSYENLTLENCHGGRDPLIQLTCTSSAPGRTGHFRNVTIKESSAKPASIVNLGGGPRNHNLENGVPYYFHDMPTSGRAIKVVSIHFPQLMTDGNYKPMPGFTGPDVLATEIADPPFPAILTPVDDLPPATIITSMRREGGKLIVQGVSQDNGKVASVSVNDRPAEITSSHAGISDWRISLDASGTKSVEARATDATGNIERMPAMKSIDIVGGE